MPSHLTRRCPARSFVLAAAGTLAGPLAPAAAQITMTTLTNHTVSALSADGSVATGSAGTRAYRWTSSTGVQILGLLPGGAFFSHGYAVNADGRIVVGAAGSGPSGVSHAFRWISDGQGGGVMHDLGVLPGRTDSIGWDVSDDGTVIAGSSDGVGFNVRAFRWVSDGNGAGVMHDLGTLPGGHTSAGHAISGDGLVVAGSAYWPAAGDGRAFRWTSDGKGGGVMENLVALPGSTSSIALGLNSDGSIVVGECDRLPNPTSSACRWNSAGQIQNLDTIPGSPFSSALGVRADGQVVVGRGRGSRGTGAAYLWNADLGTVELESYLRMLGVTFNGWRLTEARDISADGTAIAGVGRTNNEGSVGWIVQGLPNGGAGCPCRANFHCDLFIDSRDFFAFLTAYFESALAADFNADSQVDSQDLFDFIAAFFGPC